MPFLSLLLAMGIAEAAATTCVLTILTLVVGIEVWLMSLDSLRKVIGCLLDIN